MISRGLGPDREKEIYRERIDYEDLLLWSINNVRMYLQEEKVKKAMQSMKVLVSLLPQDLREEFDEKCENDEVISEINKEVLFLEEVKKELRKYGSHSTIFHRFIEIFNLNIDPGSIYLKHHIREALPSVEAEVYRKLISRMLSLLIDLLKEHNLLLRARSRFQGIVP